MQILKWIKENWMLVLVTLLIIACLIIVILFPVHSGFEY